MRTYLFILVETVHERSLQHKETLERILQFQFETGDYSIEQYDNVINLFLTEYPDGTVRK